MHQPAKNLTHLFGFVAWGDFGPLTMYRDHRHQVIAYAKAPPTKPPTPWQISQRNALRLAAELWREFDPTLKPNWERAAKRLSLKCTGFNLWCFYILKYATPYIRTIERQSKLHLLPTPPPTPPTPSSSTAPA